MDFQKFVVSRDDSIYEAWPDIVLTDTGKLICVFTECAHHVDRDKSRLVMVESTDRGRTWSKKRQIGEAGNQAKYFNNVRIKKLSDGRLAIISDRVYENERNFAEIVMWFSDDDGANWTDGVTIHAKGIVPDFKEISTGRWLLSAHFYGENNKLEQYIWYSDDKGKTWSDRITVAADPNYNLCEGSIFEAKNGTLIMFMRENSARGYDCFKAFSYDGGETWDSLYNVPIPACHRPVSGYLQDGRILITYRFMQGGGVGRFGHFGAGTQNTFMAITDEESALMKERRTQMARIIPLDYDRAVRSTDTGYTGWVQFPDGEVYIVNYIVDDAPAAYIRGYSVNINDLYIDTHKNVLRGLND